MLQPSPETCRLCDSRATVYVEFEDGCVCEPDDSWQWLCEQHWHQSEPLGGANVVIDLLNNKTYPVRFYGA